MKYSELIIINPQSNHGKSVKLFKRLTRQCSPDIKKKIKQAENIYLAPDQKISQLKNLEKYRKVFVFAGDGTVNSLIKHFFQKKIKVPIGVLPGGFGNAVSAMLGHGNKKKCMNLFNDKIKTTKIDLLQTNIKECPIAVFCIGLGLDAEIVHQRQKFLGLKSLSYLLATFQSLITFKKREFIFKISQDSLEQRFYGKQMMICNGPFYGLVHSAPDSIIDDGLMDIRCFNSAFHFLINSQPRNFNLINLNKLSSLDLRTDKMIIKNPHNIQIDGEPINHLPQTIKVTVIPKAINLLSLNLKNQLNSSQ